MKTKTLFIAVMCGLLASCGESFDTYTCSQKVRQKAGAGCDVRPMPGSKYRWIVKKADGSVWIYETMNLSNPDVSKEEQIF